MADGSRHSMYLAEESVYGQVPAAPEMETLRIRGTTLGLTKDPLQSEEIRSDRQIADFRHGVRQIAGEITTELSYGSFDTILEAVLCGTWDNDILKAGVTRRSFTILRQFDDLTNNNNFVFTGAEFNTMAMQVNANAIITSTYGIIGKDLVIQDAAPVGATFIPPTTTSALDSFTGNLLDGGTPVAVVTEVQLNLDNGIETRFVIGSKTTIRPSIGRSNLTGQVTAYFESADLLLKFIDEEESSLEFELPDGLGNLYQFELPRLKYNGGQPDVSGPGPITLSIPFQALLDPVEETNIIITRTPVTP